MLGGDILEEVREVDQLGEEGGGGEDVGGGRKGILLGGGVGNGVLCEVDVGQQRGEQVMVERGEELEVVWVV